jgi:hypothetical protein
MLKAGGPVRPEAVTLTALLVDKAGDVLEVLAGRVTDQANGSKEVIGVGETVPFFLSTPIPLRKSVARIEIVAEVRTGR